MLYEYDAGCSRGGVPVPPAHGRYVERQVDRRADVHPAARATARSDHQSTVSQSHFALLNTSPFRVPAVVFVPKYLPLSILGYFCYRSMDFRKHMEGYRRTQVAERQNGASFSTKNLRQCAS